MVTKLLSSLFREFRDEDERKTIEGLKIVEPVTPRDLPERLNEVYVDGRVRKPKGKRRARKSEN